MPEKIPCPQCDAPAEITDRFQLDSTDGPVEHVKTHCVNGHWLTPLAKADETERSTAPDPAMAALRR